MNATAHMHAVQDRHAVLDRRVVVVGNGMVGHRFVELAAVIPGIAITVLGEEPRTAYDRVHLSDYFAGSSAGDLALPDAPSTATVTDSGPPRAARAPTPAGPMRRFSR